MSEGSPAARRLIGDIGGTNARFAIAEAGRYGPVASYVGLEYASFEAAIESYLATVSAGERPGEAAFAIAGPVAGERVVLTNHPWRFAKAELQARFGFSRLLVLNDFTANAVGLPYLDPADREQIGSGGAVANAPIGVLGPGTGLGISGLLRDSAGQWLPLEGEGGHATMPAADAAESAVLDLLRQRYDHVSAERVLSGDGLVNIYELLCRLQGVASAAYKPAQIADEAMGEADPRCREAVEMFCAMLGTVAGNLALTLGARGGIFIAGGIAPRLGRRFALSAFRRRFETKGRFQAYLAPIPTYLITHANPALLGLAHLA